MRFLPFLSLSRGPDSTNRRIFRAAVAVGLSTLVVKAITAGKELLVARYFGRGDSLDAFLIAYLVPSSVIILVVGALGSAFVPVFVEVRERQGVETAQRLFSTIMVLTVAVLAGLSIVLGL